MRCQVELFYRFFGSPGSPKPGKPSQNHIALHEIKVSSKSENRRPETTLGSILEVFLGPWGDMFVFVYAFWPSRKGCEKTMDKSAEKVMPAWRVDTVGGGVPTTIHPLADPWPGRALPGQGPREGGKVKHYDHALRAFEARWRIKLHIRL